MQNGAHKWSPRQLALALHGRGNALLLEAQEAYLACCNVEEL